MLSCQNKSRTRSFGIFAVSKKAQLLAVRMTEQPILLKNLRERLIVRFIKFSTYFRLKRAVKSHTLVISLYRRNSRHQNGTLVVHLDRK